MAKYILLFFFASALILNLYAQEANITGRVFSKTTGEAIPGASIRIPGTNKGTYSSAKGFFRIRTDNSVKQLKVSSIGYETSNIRLDGGSDTVFVYLDESSVQKKNVTVTANIEPNEVIRRAIEKKNENTSKLKTFKGNLYSKLNVSLGGNMFASGGGNTLTIGASTGGHESEQYRLFLLETFSEKYLNYETKQSRTKILQRRQTSNLAPNDNIMAMGNFISFYDNEIDLIKTKIVTPLSDNALNYYIYEITEKQNYDDRLIYVIKVSPKSRLYPTFSGTIKILEGDYNLVEADLKPSENTAITFVEDMRIKQKYTESVEKIWYPSYLEISGKINVKLIAGLADLKAEATATSIYSDVQINIQLPDSLFKDDKKRDVTVAADADSTKKEFWENNSLREITPEEQAIYSKIDSLVTKDSVGKAEGEHSSFHVNWFPYLDFNRVSSITPGLSLGTIISGFDLMITGAYSFGLRKPIWEAILSYMFDLGNRKSLTVGGRVFSEVATMSLDKSYSRLVNTVFAGLFHFDYYDYMKSTGWSLFAEGDHKFFKYQAGVEFVEQTPLYRTTKRSIFSSKKWRENPEIEKGKHITAYLDGKIGEINYFVPSDDFENQVEFWSWLGYEQEKKESFYSAIGKYRTSIPIFRTGYSPIKLNLIFEGGLTSSIVPMQYMHRMQSSMLFLGKPGNFLTSKPAVYGGREYYAGHALLNLTDIWWRFLGLPLYQGRGLNLILAGSYGKFFAKGETFYLETGKQHYSEVGFGLTRIPTFLSNVIYLSFDARWGIGPIASGNFGWALSVSMPF